MTDFVFSTDGTFTTTPAIEYANPNDKWTIADAIYAYSSNADTVFSAHDNSTLINNGNIHSGSSAGVNFLGSGQITNNAGHNIVGTTGVKAADGSVVNHGQVLGLRGNGIHISDDSGNTATVFNDGHVFGRDAGVRWENFPGGVLTNNGTIESDQWGIRLDTIAGSLLTIINNGIVDGALTAIFIPQGRITLTNIGTIKGSIVCSGDNGNDTIVNKGTITGEVHLFDGNDVFSGALGFTSSLIFAGNGNDKVVAGRGAETIDGGAGNDVLAGGRGKDSLTGGADRDTFDFNSIKDSAKGGKRDVITDFTRGEDRIDLKGIDANTELGGNQKFKFIGKQGFHKEEGELRFSNKVLQGDVNGDGKADFEIFVNVGALVKGDFIL